MVSVPFFRILGNPSTELWDFLLSLRPVAQAGEEVLGYETLHNPGAASLGSSGQRWGFALPALKHLAAAISVTGAVPGSVRELGMIS